MRLGQADHALELSCRRGDPLFVRTRVFARFAEGDVAADKFVARGLGDRWVDAGARVGDVCGELVKRL